MGTKKKIKPIEKKAADAEISKLDLLEIESRIEHMEKALSESLQNINICMQHVLELTPKVKKCAERLGIES